MLILLTIAASGQARQSRIAVPVGTLVVSQHGASTTLTLESRGRTQRATLPIDHDTIITTGSFKEADFIGAVGNGVVVLSTTYWSQNGRGGSKAQCAAGQEIVLRVIALLPLPHQTYRMLLESCWESIDRMPVSWSPADSSFTIDNGEDDADEAKSRYIVYPDGSIKHSITH